MESTMRDFNREAPGRSQNSTSKMNAAAAITRRLEEKIFTTPSFQSRGDSFYNLERALPLRLVEEVQDDLAQKHDAVAPSGLAILTLGRLK